VTSLWVCPIPIEEFRNDKVTVYYYNEQWESIIFCCLADAVEFHYQAAIAGKEVLIFPHHLNPNNFNPQLVC
jgi:hypothetical protein